MVVHVHCSPELSVGAIVSDSLGVGAAARQLGKVGKTRDCRAEQG